MKKQSAKKINISTILVPVDFSKHSIKALQYAKSFAQQFHASIIMLHVVEPIIYPADFNLGQVNFPMIEKQLQEKSKKDLENLGKKYLGTVSYKTLVQVGAPFLEILACAKAKKTDIIIVATHGRTGMEHVLFGSTAEKVVRKANCPVLVVRANERDFLKK